MWKLNTSVGMLHLIYIVDDVCTNKIPVSLPRNAADKSDQEA